MARGAEEGRLFEGADYLQLRPQGKEVGLFKVFPSKGGNYSRETINRGTAIIRGNTVAV